MMMIMKRTQDMFTSATDDYLDAAIFEFDSRITALAQVLGPAGRLFKVDGMVSGSEIKTWKKGKVLYISGRLSGWCGVSFGYYDESMHAIYLVNVFCVAKDSENPSISYAGMLVTYHTVHYISICGGFNTNY